MIGLVVVAIGMAWGANAGYAINPARDFGPRITSLITGYGGAMRDQNGYLYFWLPIVAPLLGGLVGGALFKLLVDDHLTDPDEEQTEQVTPDGGREAVGEPIPEPGAAPAPGAPRRGLDGADLRARPTRYSVTEAQDQVQDVGAVDRAPQAPAHDRSTTPARRSRTPGSSTSR